MRRGGGVLDVAGRVLGALWAVVDVLCKQEREERSERCCLAIGCATEISAWVRVCGGH